MSGSAILDFFKFQICNGPKGYEGLANFVEVAETAAEIWRFFDFSKWRPTPCWIFEITNI